MQPTKPILIKVFLYLKVVKDLLEASLDKNPYVDCGDDGRPITVQELAANCGRMDVFQHVCGYVNTDQIKNFPDLMKTVMVRCNLKAIYQFQDSKKRQFKNVKNRTTVHASSGYICQNFQYVLTQLPMSLSLLTLLSNYYLPIYFFSVQENYGIDMFMSQIP